MNLALFGAALFWEEWHCILCHTVLRCWMKPHFSCDDQNALHRGLLCIFMEWCQCLPAGIFHWAGVRMFGELCWIYLVFTCCILVTILFTWKVSTTPTQHLVLSVCEACIWAFQVRCLSATIVNILVSVFQKWPCAWPHVFIQAALLSLRTVRAVRMLCGLIYREFMFIA